MSGPVGQARLHRRQRVEREPGAGDEREQQQLRAGARRAAARGARAAPRRPAMSASRSGLPGATTQPLLAARKGDHHRVVQPGRVRDRLDVGVLVVAVEPVQMDRRRRHLAAREPPQPGLAAFRQAREPAAALAQRPFQQRIVAAADDRRRRRVRERRRRDEPGRQPAVERGLREQPLAGHLGAGHGAVRHQLVELALGQPQIGGRLVGGQQVRHMNQPAEI